MSTARRSTRRPSGTVLRRIPHGTYVQIRDEPANDLLRMTYHDGVPEFLSPEARHENPLRRIARIVTLVAEAMGVPLQGTRSTRFRRGVHRKKKGFGKEPDESFYFAHASRIVGKERIDPDFDLPRDLWIEGDNRGSSKGRLPFFAALKVPEVWRYRIATARLWFVRLVDGTYQKVEHSLSLPLLTPANVLEALAMREGIIQSVWLRMLRAWVRETFLPRHSKS